MLSLYNFTISYQAHIFNNTSVEVITTDIYEIQMCGTKRAWTNMVC